MRNRWPLALALLVAASPLEGAVQVALEGEQVHVQAQAAPLNEVLDRLSGLTGMEVVYDGPAPRNPITLSIDGRTPAEAVLTILEGLGLNYALVTDATGSRVQTLLMSGATAGGPPRAAAPPATRRSRARRPNRPSPPPLARLPSNLEEEPPPDPEPQVQPATPGPAIPSYPRSPFTPGLQPPVMPPQLDPANPIQRPQGNQ